MSTIDYAYRRFCETPFAAPSEQQVAAIEAKIGVPFPAAYRQFLLAFNGGYFTEPRIKPVVQFCPEDCLTVLYGLGASHRSAELASDRHLALFDDNDPVQILPIGYTLMGNMLLLMVEPDADDTGNIVLKKAFSDACYFLADGIESFFDLLEEPTET